MVLARGLRKTHQSKGTAAVPAVDGIDLEVRRGEVFGILGPNGAGKSSTMRMIGCTSPVSSGLLRVLGADPAVDDAWIRSRLGVVPQDDCLDQELSVRENIVVFGRYFGIPKTVLGERAAELLAFVQLTEKADAKVGELSGGMRRRLTIARALVNEPDLVMLDEPTTGLDPQARHLLWDRVFLLKERGVTLLLTTHYMDEAEQLCDRLVVMDAGRIVAAGSPRELIEAHVTREVVELRFPRSELSAAAEKLRADRLEKLPDRLLVYAADGEAALRDVHAQGLEPTSALVRRSTLEDVFLTLTGRTLVD
ncbi:ABC transporter ATP-binding protein [Hamadaea flava]|uniref:ABC transporter ATP-binding protein n=1 Tax=Hamadaea flava TaxID=1742688 RepID=A0ABV8LLH5_9ACTN|nr:ABC transporter ATP-binding protein [Hamadaea flava]